MTALNLPSYNHDHEVKLIAAIVAAIRSQSTINGVEVLRAAETVAALVACLAHFMVIAGVNRSDEVLEQSIEQLVPLLLEHIHAAQDRLDAQMHGGRA